jgi:hypothetical protein
MLDHGAAAVGNDTKTMCQATDDRISVDAKHPARLELVDSEVDRAEDFKPTAVLHPETRRAIRPLNEFNKIRRPVYLIGWVAEISENNVGRGAYSNSTIYGNRRGWA